MDCLFCKIAKGEIPSAKVYEDAEVFAFLDIHPLTKGHCLVVPKQHFENVYGITDDALAKVMVAGKRIACKIKENLRADGMNFLQSNGSHAGQVVLHYHLHLIPRYENDELKIRPIWETDRHAEVSPEELQKIATQIIRPAA